MQVLIAFWSLTLMLMAVSPAMAAEPSPAPSTTHEHFLGVGVEPHWLLIGGIGLGVDFRLSNKVSLGLSGMMVPPRSNSSTQETNSAIVDYKWSYYEVYLGPKIMIMGDYDHHGLYVMPAIGYTGASISEYSSLKLSGSTNTAEARLTMGYQWVIRSLRFTVGGGLRVLNSADVVVKDNQGNELLREKSSSFGGFALDGQFAYLF